MAKVPTGLQVLELKGPLARNWPWWFAGLLVLTLAAVAALAASRSPDAAGWGPLAALAARGVADEAVAGLAVLAIGAAALAVVAIRRLHWAIRVSAQQRALLDALVAHVPVALVLTDGRDRFRANPAAVEAFGFPAASGTMAAYHATVAKLDRRAPDTGHRIPLEAGVMAGALVGRTMAQDEAVATPRGRRILHVTGAPIPFSLGPPGGLILATDVTELRAAQAALRAAKERLEQKNAQLLQMARAIGHDLGNALTPASMQLAILGMDKEAPDRNLAIVERSLDQMHRLVGDLLGLARLESGAVDIVPQRMPLADAVQEAAASHQPLAQEKGVQLAATSPPLDVMADRERVGQVLTNLVNNALKFTPTGGTVTISAEAKAGMARIAVTDTGIGLEPAQIARLFRPFSQVHDPSRIPEKGSGIGLYICKGLVERQGGSIGVTSPGPGKGSTFWFTLPLAK